MTTYCRGADQCIGYEYSQACNAMGASVGTCVNMTAAGDVCTLSKGVCQDVVVVMHDLKCHHGAFLFRTCLPAGAFSACCIQCKSNTSS